MAPVPALLVVLALPSHLRLSPPPKLNTPLSEAIPISHRPPRKPPRPHPPLEPLPTCGEKAAPCAGEGHAAYLNATPKRAAPRAAVGLSAYLRGSPPHPHHLDRHHLSNGAGGFSPGDPTPTAGRRTSTASGFIRGGGSAPITPVDGLVQAIDHDHFTTGPSNLRRSATRPSDLRRSATSPPY